ncbi:hypothetical protein KR200_004614 [Drosophila serrata]|nr:hypothetical protein KR200_004614 [Drosophila serrata]
MGHGSSLGLEPLMPMGETSAKSFWDRLYNWYYNTEEWLLMQLVFLPKLKQVHDHFFGHLKRSFLEIRHGFSLMLLNRHFSLFGARSSVPGMVEVAGLHIPKEDPKLPKDLQLFIDEAEFGVIYFALGVELQSKDLPEDTLIMFLETFRQLPQRVIWKFEGQPPCEVADNIYLAKLLPQQAILAHPNVKVFISHGGILSIIEAAHYGKPVLGMPMYLDQFRNLDVLQDEGIALQVKIENLTGKEFTETLNRLISDPSFRENSLGVSKRFWDHMNHPLDVAIYWTEYVLRNRGAHHLKVSPSHIKLLEYYSVDKFLLIGVRLTLVMTIVFLVFFKWNCLFSYIVRVVERFWPIYAVISCIVKIYKYFIVKCSF